jgi:hypothetical protein
VSQTTYYSNLTTLDPSYILPLKPRILLQSKDGSSTFYDYNAHETPVSAINITKLNVELALGQSGTFELEIEDSDRVIDRSLIGLANKVVVYVGKSNDSMIPLNTFYCRKIGTYIDGSNSLRYVMRGYGSQVITNERTIDFHKMAQRDSFGEFAPNINDTSMLAYRLFKAVFEETSILPLKKPPSIISQGGFTENGIDTRVNVFIPAISESHVEASQVLNKIADFSGADWGILNDDIFLRYPTSRHSGVTVTDISDELDLANRTSYAVAPLNFEDSMDQADGFANVILLKGGVMQTDAQSTGALGYTSLFQKDIAQQINPLAARLRNLAVIFSRAGEGGKSARKFVDGAIVADNNGTPAGLKLVDLKVPVGSIMDTPTPVFDFNTKQSVTDIQVNQKYWLVFYAKGSSEDDTIRWWHDNDLLSLERPPSAFRSVQMDSITEDRTSPGKTESTGWNVSAAGPVYSHAFFSVVRALSVIKDTASIEKYGRVEANLTADWITDPITLQMYGASLIQTTAKPLRRYTVQAVTIPNNYVFLPGDQINIFNSITGTNADAQISQVRYVFDSNTVECRRAEITPFTYFDFLTDSL